MTIRIVIVEDNPELRAAFRTLVDRAPDLACVAAHGSAEEAIAALADDAPEAVLMDIGLPGMTGIEGVRRIKQLRPATQIVMLTAFENPERVFESLQAGATGYVLKRAPSQQILDAIRDVCAGGAPMSGAVARLVVEHFVRQPRAAELDTLTDREHAVLAALSEGQQHQHQHRAHLRAQHLREAARQHPPRGRPEAAAVDGSRTAAPGPETPARRLVNE